VCSRRILFAARDAWLSCCAVGRLNAVSRTVVRLGAAAAAGLKAARQDVLAGVPWQRRQFHLMQNAMAHVPKTAIRAEVAADLRRVFDADEPTEAERRLRDVGAHYQKAPPLAGQSTGDDTVQRMPRLVPGDADERSGSLRGLTGLENVDHESLIGIAFHRR